MTKNLYILFYSILYGMHVEYFIQHIIKIQIIKKLLQKYLIYIKFLLYYNYISHMYAKSMITNNNQKNELHDFYSILYGMHLEKVNKKHYSEFSYDYRIFFSY